MSSKKRIAIVGATLLALTASSTAHASEVGQYKPGDSVPRTVDPDGFIPNVSHGKITPFAASTPVATCVNVQPSDKNVKVTNNCPNKMGIKVLIAFGSDSGCVYLEPNATYNHSYGDKLWEKKARFDGVVSC